jgi:hypothetical protein
MAYRSTALRVLISCPGDVSPDDLSTVHKTITRWNVLLGEQFEHVVVPVSWSEHAASEFGEPPQDILNRQLVDIADLGLAIFWNRLGTRTDHAESGTAEEIRRLHDAGKPVSVLRCNRPVRPSGDHAERARLDEYLKELFGNALVMNYESDAQLAAQVDTILTRMVTRHEWVSEHGGSAGGRQRASYILPRVETVRAVEPDSRGQLQTRTLQQLIFKNEGQSEGREIQWRLEAAEGVDGHLPFVTGNGDGAVGLIPVLAGGAEFPYTLSANYGVASMVLCLVDWQESGGIERHAKTTLSVI